LYMVYWKIKAGRPHMLFQYTMYKGLDIAPATP